MAAHDWWERRESNRLLLGFNETLEPFQLHSPGGVGASRTRSSPSRLIDVADRRLTVRPPLRDIAISPRSVLPGRHGAAPIAGAREAAQRATARASTPRKDLTQSFERMYAVFKGRAEPDVHDRARDESGVTDQTRTDFNRLHKPAPRPLRPRSPCGPGRSRTAFVRFGIALVAATRTRTNTKGTGLRRSPRGTHKSFGACVMTWRSYLPAARRTSRTLSRSDDTNSRIARCNLGVVVRVGWMRFAAS